MPLDTYSDRLDVKLYSYPHSFTGLTQIAGSTSVDVVYDDVVSKVKSSLPRWKEYKDQHGFLPVLPYEVWKARNQVPYVAYWNQVGRKPSNFDGFWEGTCDGARFWAIPTKSDILAEFASGRNVALNDARAKFSSHIQNIEWDVLVDIAEAKETARLMLGTLKDVNKYVRNFRRINGEFYRHAVYQLKQFANVSERPFGRSNVKALKPLARTLNSKYLEFTYGWNPLVASVEDAAKLLEHRLAPHTHRVKFSGKGIFKDTSKVSIKDEAIATFAQHSVDLVKKYKYEVWIGGQLKKPEEQSLASAMGLEVLNIPSVLWELTRFSFLIDYVVNVGDFINNVKLSALRIEPSTLYMSEKMSYSLDPHVIRFPHARDADTAHTVVNKGVLIRPYYAEYFKRSPITVADTLVRLNVRSPNAKQLFNTFSVMLSTLGALK